MLTDYSKWDRLEVSSSDGDSGSEDDAHPAAPRVTRLEAPSRITFGGGSPTIAASPPAPGPRASPAAAPLAPREAPAPEGTGAAGAPPGGNASAPSAWTERGGLVFVDAAAHGHRARNLYWSQDRYSVVLRLELEGAEKVGSVTVGGILPYRDRCAAAGTARPVLSAGSRDGTVLLEGELPHPVHLDEDEEVVDWSVEAAPSEATGRYLCVALRKAVPMQGLSVWWRRPLTEFPEADLGAIRGAELSKGGSDEFLRAWEEAHKVFREGKPKRLPRNGPGGP
ncbi:unnamed protein product [Pseudo-nitzschia multistriata]|uniref:CS domain-containing protein n=1 Tax=Pseudo-nitzschia multistriata TaxID=183589 RepID=A0A448YXR9_9STRA|nr:unnamed protein product [Pseudo-nitzschia multistriata]